MFRVAGVCSLLVVVSMSAALAGDPESASRLDAVLSTGTLKVGTTGDYRPFTFRDPTTGELSGFDIDQAKSLAEALGVKVSFVPTSWPTLMQDFKADKFDIAMGGVSITLERQKAGLFSIPYMEEGKTPIARCEDKDRFETIADIDRPEVTVVVNPGGTNEKFARAHLTKAQIKVFPDNTRIFDEIAAGNADLMITDASETRYQQKLHPGVLCAIHPDDPFDFAEKGYWIQRDPYLKAFVDQWLYQSMKNGSYEAIYARWFE